MHLDEPSWWYGEQGSGIAACLAPLGAAYGWIAQTRFAWGSPYRSRLPVVCVGNFSAGGTGKTPLVMHLCRRLQAMGQRPAALTRGYRGRLGGPHWVGEDDTAREVGDEALLLARVAPTLVARDRRAGACAIEADPHQISVIVMDDGLQNPLLAKDLVIAVVDGGRGLGNGRVIPAGPLRAPLDFQLGLSGAIVVNEALPGAGGQVIEWLRRRFDGPVLRAATTATGDTSWLAGARVVAWAGIGAPQRFFAMLEKLGAVLVERVPYGDHEQLSDAEAERLLALAQHRQAMLVATEKDLARLQGATEALARLAAATRVLPIEIRMDAADAERLAALLEGALKVRRHPSDQ